MFCTTLVTLTTYGIHRFSPFGRFHVHQASRAAKQEEQRLQQELQRQQLQLQEQLKRQQQQSRRSSTKLSAAEDQARTAQLRKRQQQLLQQQVQLTQLAPPSREESLNLTSAVWFSWGVLLNSGIGEGEK